MFRTKVLLCVFVSVLICGLSEGSKPILPRNYVRPGGNPTKPAPPPPQPPPEQKPPRPEVEPEPEPGAEPEAEPEHASDNQEKDYPDYPEAPESIDYDALGIDPISGKSSPGGSDGSGFQSGCFVTCTSEAEFATPEEAKTQETRKCYKVCMYPA